MITEDDVDTLVNGTNKIKNELKGNLKEILVRMIGAFPVYGMSDVCGGDSRVVMSVDAGLFMPINVGVDLETGFLDCFTFYDAGDDRLGVSSMDFPSKNFDAKTVVENVLVFKNGL